MKTHPVTDKKLTRIRELSGIIAEQNRQIIDLVNARQAALDEQHSLVMEDRMDMVTQQRILDVVLPVITAHGVSLPDVVGRCRQQRTMVARHDAIRSVRTILPDVSLSDIGRFFNRDHGTVIHALTKSKARPVGRGLASLIPPLPGPAPTIPAPVVPVPAPKRQEAA